MRLSERSFPYPVVGNRDDVPGASFQATVEVTFDATTTFIDVVVANGSETLRDLIRKHRASYVAHIECSNTLFRTLHRSFDPVFRVGIPKTDLNDTVEINVVAMAECSIPDYRLVGQHDEYGKHVFAVNKGDILATYPGLQLTIDRDFSSFQKIDSIVTLLPYPDDQDRPMSIQCDDDKLTVYLSKNDFRDYGLLRSSALAPILATTIVLPVITEAVRVLKESPDDIDFRWSRAVKKKLVDLGKTLDEDPLTLAQALLELPIKRALSSAVAGLDTD